LPQQFDLDVAIGTQLDQTGLWIGRSRFISTPIEDVYFSWDVDGLGWEQGLWQGAFDPDTGVTRLDDETYRLVLYAKAAANVWDGSLDKIVEILTPLFSLDEATVVISIADNQDMTMEVNIVGNLQNKVFRSLLLGNYIPIKPIAVGITYNLPLITQFINDAGFLALGDDTGWPRDPAGLLPGAVWSDARFVAVVPGHTPNPAAPPVYLGQIDTADLLALGGGDLPLTPPTAGSFQLWNAAGFVAIA
jgi:hypothetical protein